MTLNDFEGRVEMSNKEKQVILVVDDQPFDCDLIVRLIGDRYAVKAFTSGEAALKYLENNMVDLALLDYEMPGMTGYEVLFGIHMNKNTSNIPCIFITGVYCQRLEVEIRERGATDYILKPINRDKLLACIEKYI
jgi:response regulator RpfG family c-di-GMP phosphodiesterase